MEVTRGAVCCCTYLNDIIPWRNILKEAAGSLCILVLPASPPSEGAFVLEFIVNMEATEAKVLRCMVEGHLHVGTVLGDIQVPRLPEGLTGQVVRL